jgi:hypothetical protein
MYIAQRPASINVCGEIDRVTAVAGGLLLLIWVIVCTGNFSGPFLLRPMFIMRI